MKLNILKAQVQQRLCCWEANWRSATLPSKARLKPAILVMAALVAKSSKPVMVSVYSLEI